MSEKEKNKWSDLYDRCEYCGLALINKSFSIYCSDECKKCDEELNQQIIDVRNKFGYE